MGQIVSPVTLEKGLKATFFKAYEAESPSYLKFSTVVPSGSDQEKYGWLGSAPNMREWKDERIPKGLIDHDYTIKNKDWEASIGVSRNALKDDQMGQVKVRIADLGSKAKTHPNSLAFDTLVAGLTNLCYDGQFFFDTDHEEGDSTAQSNKLTGTGVTLAQVTADFKAARAAMKKLKDDRGEKFFTNPDALKLLVIAPVELEDIFEQLLNSRLINNTDNTLKGAAELMVYPFDDVNDWYLCNIGGNIKPLIFQSRQTVEFSALEGKSESGFWRKHWFYGVDARYNLGYGLWQNAIITTNT